MSANPSPETRDGEITRLLGSAQRGNRDALDALLPLVYDEMRRLAHGRLRAERGGHTLNTTALVHEAYLKLVDQTRGDAEEVRPVAGGSRAATEPHPRLVHECRRVEGLPGPLAPHLRVGDSAQLVVDERQQRVERVLVAGTRRREERGHGQ